MQLKELADYIGSLLEVARYRDYCPNGVQLEGRSAVRKLATAVTASQAAIEAARDWGADVLLTHHGYFWRGEDAALTGIKKKRIATLLASDISLLAYHLPLDAHAELGNNAQLARRFAWVEAGRFGEQDIACHGSLAAPQTLAELCRQLEQGLQRTPLAIGAPERKLSRIAWCSGAAQSHFEQAVRLGVDVFVTGEISEQNVHLAQESGVAFIAAGHHATERYGVQALGEHLQTRFELEYRFFDQDVPV